MYDDNNSLMLLATIKGVANKFESQKNIYVSIDMAKSNFYSSCQGQSEANATYMTQFKDLIAVIEHYGGSIGDDIILIQEEKRRGGNTKGTVQEEAMFAESARNRAHAVAFLRCADQTHYSLLVNDLKNQFSRGNYQYPASVNDAYNLLINYKRPGGTNSRMCKATQSKGTAGNGTAGQQATASTPTEVAFAQTSATNKNDGMQCYNCQAMGHYASECTVPKCNQEN
jgi:Zinc knuckle